MISHYRITTLLGGGGMGEVYKAEDTRLKRTVAIKVLPRELMQDRAARERLVLEAQAASALDHPNICTIHEIDETPDGRVFLAMAYYDGETLRERIARGPLATDEALALVAQVARAIAAAHDASIIHRDIKPANIIVTRRGEVKLLDFGIAKLAGRTALTRTGATVGTVAYMAPEQLEGRADERSDVWALGVVLYEMIAGRSPFAGDSEVAVIRAIAHDPPRSLGTVRPGTPETVNAITARALQKQPSARFRSALEFLSAVDALRAPVATAGQPVGASDESGRFFSRRTVARGLAAALVVTLSLGGWFMYRAARVRSARQQLPQLRSLIRQELNSEAYILLRRIEPYLSSDPDFAGLRESFLLPISIRTDPPGADVFWKPYNDVDGDWEHLGRSPLATRGPIGYFRWRATKPGFVTFEGAESAVFVDPNFVLAPEGSVPDGMVRVPGGNVAISTGGESVRLPDFFIDRCEVTNREFKKFMDAGGYRRQDYWQEPFDREGRSLSWDEAMAEFRDTTGRPGPSTWELGTYPDGHDDDPVQGVSWYEAAAFARFVGKTLPTIHHWRKAAGIPNTFSNVLELSNFSGKGPAAVGHFKGLGPYGTYDMAGNVKEWCWNTVSARRYILGGSWNEPNYQFLNLDARLPFDRSPSNGFRTIKQLDAAALPESALRPIEQLTRDYSHEKPASDELFRAYLGLYSYDRSDLKPAIESVDDRSPAWRVERITYAAAYGNERIVAYLFVPKNAAQPYQTVLYFPHSGGFALRSFEQAEMSYLGFLVKDGRALLFPMVKGMYERRVSAPSGPNAVRDVIIQQMKDLQRSVDYLQTRRDIAADRLAYFGVSFGAAIAPVALAVERRFSSAVLWSGGLRLVDTSSYGLGRPLPETDPFNFAPRVKTPVMMLNGRDDFLFPIEASQLPLFRLLRAADADKRHVLYDGGHVFPFARVEKDTLDWLDRYLGTPR